MDRRAFISNPLEYTGRVINEADKAWLLTEVVSGGNDNSFEIIAGALKLLEEADTLPTEPLIFALKNSKAAAQKELLHMLLGHKNACRDWSLFMAVTDLMRMRDTRDASIEVFSVTVRQMYNGNNRSEDFIRMKRFLGKNRGKLQALLSANATGEALLQFLFQ